MELGSFSVSLSVKDMQASRDFYTKLGFEIVDGQHNYEGVFEMQEGQDWLILRNGEATLGLFQGMFEGNALTFNPADVRTLQAALRGRGVEFVTEADESGEGPGSATLVDPDGNAILLDQH